MKVKILVVAIVAILTGSASAQPSAEILHAQGKAAYDAGDYATAVAKWQASYDLSRENGLLFNLAQAKRLSRDCVGSLATYRQFLASDADPASDPHKIAEDFARDLERTCTIPVPSDARPQSYPVDRLNSVDRLSGHEDLSTRRARTLRIAGLATGGAGAAALVTGLVLGSRASAIGAEITTACAVRCDWAVQRDKEARGRRYATIGYALDGVGIAAIAGGAVLYYLGHESPVAVAPAPERTGAMVSWSGSW